MRSKKTGSSRFRLEDPEHRSQLAKIKTRGGRSALDVALEAFKDEKKIPTDSSQEKQKGIPHFGAKGGYIGGVYWHSVWEHECWLLLKDLERRSVIEKLERQVRYEFEHNGVMITTYKADFTFFKDGMFYVCDSKQEFTAKTPRWRLVTKCMRAWYNLEVLVFWKGVTDVQKLVSNLGKV